MKRTIRPINRIRATSLRANTTNAERRLWYALKKIPISGSHFRKQVPIGPYIVDLACMRAKLIIEIDGGQHSEDTHAKRDAARTSWLEQEGYCVVRFWNHEVMNNIDGVLEVIQQHLTARTHPTPARSARRPSPSRGG